MFGKIVRFLFLGLLCLSAVIFLYRYVFSIVSEQAYINTKLVTLRTPIAGSLYFGGVEVGMSLKKGQLVFRVVNPRYGNENSNNLYISLKRMKRELEEKLDEERIRLVQYKRDYDRFSSLLLSDSVAKRDVEEYEIKYKISRARIRDIKRRLKDVKEALSAMKEQLELQYKSEVFSPVNGVVWALLKKEGEHINKGDEIVQVVNPEAIWVDAFFKEEDASQLKVGEEVNIKILGAKRVFRGRIEFIRGGVGRVDYAAAIESPPSVLTRRLTGVRIRLLDANPFDENEFFGVGRSVVVFVKRRHPFNGIWLSRTAQYTRSNSEEAN